MRISTWLLILSLLSAWAWAGPGGWTMEMARDHVSLNGVWQVLPEHGTLPVWETDTANTLGPWTAVTVPGLQLTQQEQAAHAQVKSVWVRRTVTLSAAQAMRGAVLRWNNIRFGATAWINGKEVGQHILIGPATLMIPAGVLKAGENTMLLNVPGWAGIPKGKSGWPLIPVGSATQGWGTKSAAIPEDIWIEFYESLYLKRVLAQPMPAKNSVTFDLRVVSAAPLPAALTLQYAITPPDGKDITGTVIVPLADGAAACTVAIPQPQVWSPATPRLYTAHLQALGKDDAVYDDVRFRFGMRDIAVVNGHYQLNGQPLRLHGSSLVAEWNWGDTFNQEIKRYIVDEARAMNLNCFRSHTLPPPPDWMEVFDDYGTMLLAELPLLYNYSDPRLTADEYEVLHTNALLDAEGWITRLGNHPAIVHWVICNESKMDPKWEMGTYADAIRAIDPTRPLMRASEWTSDVIDTHPCSNFTNGPEGMFLNQVYRWVNRKSPTRTLSNTEYMNLFATKPVYANRWLGTTEITGFDRVFAEIALEHTEAMRRGQFDCILPYMYAGWPRFRANNWRPDYPTPMAAALHSAMAPVLASLDLFDRNFITGRQVTTSCVLLNELPTEVTATLDLIVTPEDPLNVPDETALGKAVSQTQIALTLPPFSKQERQLTWQVPQREGVYYLAAVVRRAGDRPVVSQREVRAITLAPPAGLAQKRILLLGADQRAQDWFTTRKIAVDTDFPAGNITADVVLIWDAATIKDQDAMNTRLLDFARQGGRIVVLDQRDWQWTSLVDVALSTPTNQNDATISRVFPTPGADHPMFTNILPRGLQRWNGLPGDVADRAFTGAALGNGKKLLWGLDPAHVVTLSLSEGQGEIIMSQLLIRDHVMPDTHYDPIAEGLLLNLLGR